MNHLLGLSLTAQTPRKQLASKIMREITHLGLGKDILVALHNIVRVEGIYCFLYLEPTLTTFTRLLKAFTLSGELVKCVCV